MKLYLFIVLTVFTSTLSAQENTSMVLDKYFQTIGGQISINRVRNIYSFANCSGPNGKYLTEIQSFEGTKSIFRQIRENKPDYTGITNGDTYWTKGADLAIANKLSAFAWHSHELQWIATHLTERFRDIKFAGNENFAGKETIKFSATDELNQKAYLYFDKSTNLLYGLEIFSPFGENPEIIRLIINDWKKVRKVLLPSKATFIDKQGQFVLNFQVIKINHIDQSVFDIPEKIIAIKKLMELHDLQRTAHFNRDAKLLVSIMADDYVEIRNGNIYSPGKEELVKRFQGYFDSVTFIEWDDIEPPIIKVSDDATMAFVYVKKRVRLLTKEKNEELTTFAWTSNFQKINDIWLMISITSTVVR